MVARKVTENQCPKATIAAHLRLSQAMDRSIHRSINQSTNQSIGRRSVGHRLAIDQTKQKRNKTFDN